MPIASALQSSEMPNHVRFLHSRNRRSHPRQCYLIQWIGDPGNGVVLRISPNITIGVQGTLQDAKYKLDQVRLS